MMKSIKWRSLIITSIMCLLPIALGVALWDELPDVMATHFDINNVPNGFMPKWAAVFMLPALMALLQIFCCVSSDINSKRKGINKKFETIMKGIIPVVTIVICISTLGYALEKAVDIRMVAMLIVGVAFVVMGNYLPKLNYLNTSVKQLDTENAKKINRICGYAMVIMGIIFIATIFLPPVFSVMALFLLVPYVILLYVLIYKEVKQ